MKTEKRWQKDEVAVREAKALAEMANLEPSYVNNFEREHPDFVPDLWWKTTPDWSADSGLYVQWIRERDRLREAWVNEFPADRTLDLTANNPTFLMAHRLESQNADEAEATRPKIWPYQRAVLFLHVDSWRAKTCEWCKRRFVAESSNARFCTFGAPGDDWTTCFAAHRKHYKTEKWNETSDTINNERRRKYRAEKQKESHAKRKNLRKG
jgi:hypothetical protein